MEKSVIDVVATKKTEGNLSVVILYAYGNLDHGTYLDLIAKARELYDRGERNLILNMTQIPIVSRLCGLFALHSIAAIFSGKEPLDPTIDWQALHELVNWDSRLQQHFKLLRPRPDVEQTLKQAGLPIYDSLRAAVASFSQQQFSHN